MVYQDEFITTESTPDCTVSLLHHLIPSMNVSSDQEEVTTVVAVDLTNESPAGFTDIDPYFAPPQQYLNLNPLRRPKVTTINLPFADIPEFNSV